MQGNLVGNLSVLLSVEYSEMVDYRLHLESWYHGVVNIDSSILYLNLQYFNLYLTWLWIPNSIQEKACFRSYPFKELVLLDCIKGFLLWQAHKDAIRKSPFIISL